MKAVIYARYSSDNQREESIEGQLRECNAYAERKGLTVIQTYADRAKTGKTDNRPEFQRMITDSKKGLFDVIIVWKIDRFSRDKYDSAHYKFILKNNNIKLISATEPIDETPEGQLMESIFEGMAAYYVAELAVKVNRGMTENALKCKFNGGTVPFGYTIDSEQHYQVDHTIAPIVRGIYVDYANDKTIKMIVDELNQKGIRTSSGSKMSINAVTYMLKNRRYLGEYKHKDIVIENAFEPIVSKELFDIVQDKMQKNKKAPARKKQADGNFVLTTKLICGKCGAFLAGDSGTSRLGKTHYYYKCSNAKNKRTCDKKALRKDEIENKIFNATIEMLNDENLVNQFVADFFKANTQDQTELQSLQQQLTEVEKSAENIVNAIQQGVLNDFTKSRLDELQERKEQLEIAILKEKIVKPALTKEQLHAWFDGFRRLDPKRFETRKTIIDVFVNAFYVYDDEGQLSWNYKKGTKTLSLKDFERSSFKSVGQPSRNG